MDSGTLAKRASDPGLLQKNKKSSGAGSFTLGVGKRSIAWLSKILLKWGTGVS